MDATAWDIFVGIVAALASWEVISNLAKRAWQAGPGMERHAEERLNLIANGYSLDYLIGLLGKPAMARSVSRTISVLIEGSLQDRTQPFQEVVFVDPLFFATLLADELGTVVAWAATSRSSEFRPEMKTGHPGAFLAAPVRINKTLFPELGPLADHEEWVGARRMGHFETFYYGNPGMYQWYIAAYNDAAPGDGERLLSEWYGKGLPNGGPNGDVAKTVLEEQRAKSTFNTYGAALNRQVITTGPDLDEVRLFPKAQVRALPRLLGRLRGSFVSASVRLRRRVPNRMARRRASG